MKNKKITIEDLAGMVADGFLGMSSEFKKEIAEVKQDTADIKLRLDNVAYRFELKELKTRVEVLEDKVGVNK